MRRLAALAVLLTGCGRYADFALPPPLGVSSRVSPSWDALRDPVITRGKTGEWDSVDALNPSVVVRGDTYYNFYSGFDGRTWHTGLATSTDGRTWRKQGKVLSPDAAGWEGAYIAANGSALDFRGDFHYWYQAGEPPRLGLARSADGRTWRKETAAVLSGGPRGSWDERAVADPYVISSGDWLYLFYLGEDRARRQRLGVARSRDGIHWDKERSGPVLELGEPGAFDENGLGEPAVWTSHGAWWMLYTGRDRLEKRRIGLAWSRDGRRWQRFSEAPVLGGTEAWNAQVVCDPTLLLEPGGVRVWFGGGDLAHPAENIHGQIGFATLKLLVN